MPQLTTRTILTVCVLLGTGCTDTREREVDATVPIDQVVQWDQTISLEENDEVINVRPQVHMSSTGALMVADSRETQVRLYDPAGRLVHHFVQKGSGPDEFQRIASAVRLPEGRIFVADMNGKFAVFGPGGAELMRTGRIPLGPLYGASMLNDTLLVLTGRSPGNQAPSNLVHLWNFSSDSLVRSFYRSPEPPSGLEGAYTFNGFVDAAARNDTIAVLFALSDTVYLFDADGREAGKLPVPASQFRSIRDPLPRDASLNQFREWTGSFSSASHIFWASDGTIFVQYYDQVEHEIRWRLVGMTREGRIRFEAMDTPKLLDVAGDEPTLVFLDPNSQTPNALVTAQLDTR